MSLFGRVRRAVDRDSVRDCATRDPVVAAWMDGDLRHILHTDQLRVYDHFRAWSQIDPETAPRQRNESFPRIYVLDIGRRWGKTTLMLAIKTEDAIRTPGSVARYATAFQLDIEEILDDVSRYVYEGCPAELRPVYHSSSKARSAGLYFPGGSILRLVGLDRNPDGLRGRSSDGDVLSESAFVSKLAYNVKNVLYPQYQGKPRARLILESSAPFSADTEYDRVFVDDAKQRGAYAYATIDDNPRLTVAAREEFIAAAGGREHADCQREYYNLRVRDGRRAIVPEFIETVHVRDGARPRYVDCYVGADPGMTDLFAAVWGHWDHERGKLVVERDWAAFNAGTRELAAVLRSTEEDLWRGVQRWNGKTLVDNPRLRVSDVDKRLIQDLRTDHGIAFTQALKDDAAASLSALRHAFASGRIEIRPQCVTLIAHLNAGRWNEAHTHWERSERYGHYDAIAALKYLWRHVDRNSNPMPPDSYQRTPGDMFLPAVQERQERVTTSTLARAFSRSRH